MNATPELRKVYTDIQFYHGTKHKFHNREFTLAMTMPTVNFLKDALHKAANLSIQSTYELSFGVSYVNKEDKDNYNRKLGRILSTERITSQEVTLGNVRVHNGISQYVFYNDKVSFVLETRSDRDKVYLREATNKTDYDFEF